MPSKNNLLIISYTFPPDNGIGGRRWAKMGKYIQKNGFEVFVLSAQFPSNAYSSWNHDVEKLSVINFNSLYPKVLITSPGNLRAKICYRFWRFFLPLITKGTIYDKACLDKQIIIDKASTIITKHNIRNVVVTGAPFSILNYGTILKDSFPHLNLIADIRDPWTWGSNYGFFNLNKKRIIYEQNLLETVVAKADFITVPAKAMQDFLQEKFENDRLKIKILPHGIDTDDFQFLKKSYGRTGIRFIYGGTLYEGIESMFEKLLKVSEKNAEKDFCIDFYTSDNKYQDKVKVKNLHNKIRYYKYIPSAELINEIKNADYYLIMYPDKYKHFLSSKFFEIFYAGIPIIYIGHQGDVGDFILENNLGIVVSPENTEEVLTAIINKDLKVTSQAYKDIDKYYYNNIVSNNLNSLFKLEVLQDNEFP